MEHGPRVMIYDRNLAPQYPLDRYESIEVKLDINAVGIATITLPADHTRRSDLHIAGRRAVITDPDGRFLMSGPITRVTSSSPVAGASLTVTVEDDVRVLSETLGWVNPYRGPDAQQTDNQDSKWSLKASAESAFKVLVGDNFSRLGLPYRIADSQSRGPTIELRSRMAKLSDVIFPLLPSVGIMPTIRQQPKAGGGQEVVVDCYTPTTRMRPLKVTDPQVTAWSYETVCPAATGGVAGGQGQGTARVFRTYWSPDLRNQWGPYWAGEIFDDQRQESRADSLDAALKTQVEQMGPSTALSLSMESTAQWRYGVDWTLGDNVRVQLSDTSPLITIQVTQVTHSHTKDKGYRITSECHPTSVPKTTRSAVYQLSRRIRYLETGL